LLVVLATQSPIQCVVFADFVLQLRCIADACCASYSISYTVCCICIVLQLHLCVAVAVFWQMLATQSPIHCVAVAVCYSCSFVLQLQMMPAVIATQSPIQCVAVAVVCCSCSVLQMFVVIATQSPTPNDYRADFQKSQIHTLTYMHTYTILQSNARTHAHSFGRPSGVN